MPNTQLEKLLSESDMEAADREQFRRIFAVLTEDRQARLVERDRFFGTVRAIRRNRERIRSEQESLVDRLVADLAGALRREAKSALAQ